MQVQITISNLLQFLAVIKATLCAVADMTNKNFWGQSVWNSLILEVEWIEKKMLPTRFFKVKFQNEFKLY